MSVEFLSPARSKSKLNTFNSSANSGKSSWILMIGAAANSYMHVVGSQ